VDRIKGPVVINFFATWCVDCRSDMPLTAKRAPSRQGRFSLLGVDCCDDNRTAVPGFLSGLGVQGDFRLLAYDDDRHLARAYGLLGPPTTFFLDKDHVLRNLVIGPLTAGTLDAGLRAAGACRGGGPPRPGRRLDCRGRRTSVPGAVCRGLPGKMGGPSSRYVGGATPPAGTETPGPRM